MEWDKNTSITCHLLWAWDPQGSQTRAKCFMEIVELEVEICVIKGVGGSCFVGEINYIKYINTQLLFLNHRGINPIVMKCLYGAWYRSLPGGSCAAARLADMTMRGIPGRS